MSFRSIIFTLLIVLSSAPQLAGASLKWTHNTTDQLIRTIQIGSLQGISLGEVYDIALDDRTEYHEHVLARAALAVLGKEGTQFEAWPLSRLLDRSLQQLVPGQLNSVKPAGFRNEHTIYTLAFAMVMAGQQEALIKVLEQHLNTRISFKRAVILQALRNIGSRDANELIQQVANEVDNQSQLATNLLADYHYPFLQQLAQRIKQIPIDQREPAQLLHMAKQDPCSIPSSLAVYLLGFFPNDDHSEPALNSEINQTLKELNTISCFYTRFFARRSLAMRSTETSAYWIEQFVAEQDAWQRAQLGRILFIHHGEEFKTLALDLLSSEEAQYVQWELMHGYFEWQDKSNWLSWWDLWLPSTLQMRLDLSKKQQLKHEERELLLRWLEAGNHPPDEWVHNHLLNRLAGMVRGDQLIRLLDYFAALPDFHQRFWVLQNIRDNSALEQVKRWQQQYSDEPVLNSLIDKLNGL